MAVDVLRVVGVYLSRMDGSTLALAPTEKSFWLAYNELVSFTVPANRKSRRVMEKLGMAHDPSDDFDHPRLPEGHPLRWHVLYGLRRSGWSHFQILSTEVLR